MGEKRFSAKELGVEDVAIGKLRIKSNEIVLLFKNGKKITITDWQMCCEKRYFRTDDTLNISSGTFLVHIAIKPARSIEGRGTSYHEVTFLEIMTSKGFVTISCHNEHNGYYAGPNLRLEIEGKNNKLLGKIVVAKDSDYE